MSGGCEVESFAKLDRGIWWKSTYLRSCFFMPMHRWTGHLLVSWQRGDGRTVSALCVGGYFLSYIKSALLPIRLVLIRSTSKPVTVTRSCRRTHTLLRNRSLAVILRLPPENLTSPMHSKLQIEHASLLARSLTLVANNPRRPTRSRRPPVESPNLALRSLYSSNKSTNAPSLFTSMVVEVAHVGVMTTIRRAEEAIVS